MSAKRKLTWESEDMRRALTEVHAGTLTISAASKEYNIPRMTLSDRFHKKVAVDARVGRPGALSKADEDSLVHYIKYMYERRFPVERSQVLSLAWAIDLKMEQRSFGENGPSLHWWRGFRDRHPELSLRKAESVDRCRVSNATEENIGNYFDVLEQIICDNDLQSRPHLIFNCDETAIMLNKSAKRVLVPRKSKHVHTLATATSQHVSVLCTVSAAGCHIPPLMVFSKGYPVGSRWREQGVVNCAYSQSQSGFVDREIYTEWFTNVFLRYAPAERPLLLLQDGASAHLGPELIDRAIENNVILLCFPPKLTHLLQPCDVVLYKPLKNHLATIMRQVKMLRGELWVSKNKIPAVFREAFEVTFTPGLITSAFKKSGIYPLNRNVVPKEMMAPTAAVAEARTNDKSEDISGAGTSYSSDPNNPSSEHNPLDTNPATTQAGLEEPLEWEIEVITPSQVPANAEPLHEVTQDSVPLPCPPSLAVQAIEGTLTPRKLSRYQRMEQSGDPGSNDPVYATWAYLRGQLGGPYLSLPLQEKENGNNPLVKAGIIPQRLADVFHAPPEKMERIPTSITKQARVLTSSEIVKEIKSREAKKRKADLKREENKKADAEELRKSKKITKQRGWEKVAKSNQVRAVSISASEGVTPAALPAAPPVVDCLPAMPTRTNNAYTPTELERYFSHLQVTFMCCTSYKALKAVMPSELRPNKAIESPYPNTVASTSRDQCSETLLSMGFDDMNLRSVGVLADGNCLPRVASMLATGEEKSHVEMRIRIVHELAMHDKDYLDNRILARGTSKPRTKWAMMYATYSPHYNPGTKLSEDGIRDVFEKEVMDIIKPGEYCGIWQIHALSSIIGVPVQSLYPGRGPPKKHLNRTVMPRQLVGDETSYILWTHTHNTDLALWWGPNHFVAALPAGPTPRACVPKSLVASQAQSVSPVESIGKPAQPDEWYCIFCGDTFSNSRGGEKWIACQGTCRGWAHLACTVGKSIFVCPYCTD